MTKNADVKKAAKDAGVRLWEIAEALDVADTTLSKRLRHELTGEQKAEIYAIIRELSGGENNG